MKIVKCKLLKYIKVQGMTIAPFCILIRPDKINDKKLMKHEAAHWNQAKRLWYIGFYISYFVQWIFGGYYNISFEIEARKSEVE